MPSLVSFPEDLTTYPEKRFPFAKHASVDRSRVPLVDPNDSLGAIEVRSDLNELSVPSQAWT